MTAPAEQPDAPPPPEPFAGSWLQLMDRLVHDSYRLRGSWAWQLLPPSSGFLDVRVAMRVTDGFTREIAITTAGELETANLKQRWAYLVSELQAAANEYDARLGITWAHEGQGKRANGGWVTRLGASLPGAAELDAEPALERMARERKAVEQRVAEGGR